MKLLKSLHKYIPGFRQLSARSMAVAATYYIAAAVILAQSWYIGLALLALPFLIFNLVDLNAGKSRRVPIAVACAAGLLVLLSSAVALSPGAVPSGAETVRPSPSSSTAASPTADAQPPAATPSPSAAASRAAVSQPAGTPIATATPTAGTIPTASPDEAEYAYVAARGSEVFHLPDCTSAKRIKPENRIGYKTRDEAVAAGLRPCKRCKP